MDAKFAPVEIGEAVTLRGGCLAKAEILETRQTHCGKTFVKIEKTAPWLARAVTGKPHSGRPLSRTNIIEAMRAKLHTGTIPAEAPASADAPDDPMAAMDYEDMADASAVAEPNLESPPKQRKRLRRLRVEAEQLVSMAIATESWGGVAGIHGSEERRVTLLACARHLWLHVDDLAWFINAMRHQYSTGGVPPVQKDATGHTADQRNVWWSFRDSAWVCRAKHEGRTYVKTICVTRLAKRGHDGYELTKTNAYDALCDWQRHVEAGGEPGEGAIPMDADEAGADAEAAAGIGAAV